MDLMDKNEVVDTVLAAMEAVSNDYGEDMYLRPGLTLVVKDGKLDLKLQWINIDNHVFSDIADLQIGTVEMSAGLATELVPGTSEDYGMFLSNYLTEIAGKCMISYINIEYMEDGDDINA